MSQNEDEVFDAKLREHWGVPPAATPELRARVLNIAAESNAARLTRRRRLITMAAVAVVVLAVVPAGMRILRPSVDGQPVLEELVWFDSAEDDDVDMDVSALFTLAELSDAEQ